MRKWHRWSGAVFGVFLLFMAGTGIAIHVVDIYNNGGLVENEDSKPSECTNGDQATSEGHRDTAIAGQPVPPGKEPSQLLGILHHLHSGETFGPIGTIFSTLFGFALLFFAFSGLWMYLQMFRQRRTRGKRDVFWE